MENNSTKPDLTIVTISKNDPKGLTRTLKSLAGCEFDRVEVLIVDSSRDPSESASLQQRYLPAAVLHWTPPSGIFSAMNTGLNQTSGEYVWFLNGGDELSHPLALKIVLDALSTKPAWLYGQVEFTKDGINSVTPAPFDYELEKSRRFSHGRFPPHQGTIVRTDLAQELGGFNPKYKITSDYDLMLKLSQVSTPTEIPVSLSRFWTGGTSSTHWSEAITEFQDARKATLNLSAGQLVRDRFATDWLLTKTFLAKLRGFRSER